MRGELHVEIANRSRSVPRLSRRRRLLCADTAQSAEDSRRVSGNRPQHSLAVFVAEALGTGRTDVTQASQVGNLARSVGGIERQRPPRPQLPSIARMCLPIAAYFGPLAGAQVGDRADQSKPLARLGVLHLQHRVAIVFSAEDDTDHFDRASEGGRIGVEESRGVAHTAKLAAYKAARVRVSRTSILGNPKYAKMSIDPAQSGPRNREEQQ